MTTVDDLLAGRNGAADRVVETIRTERARGTSLTLDELGAAAAAGSAAALQVLLRATVEFRLAERPVRSILLDQADVDDAVQNTLIGLLDRISQFEGRASFSTWLHTVARNEALGVLRRKRPGAVLDDANDGRGAFVNRLSSIVADQQRVRRAIVELPPGQREVIELREIDGLAYEEIAQRLGIEIGTVRSRLSRAREALAILLGTAAL